MATWAQRPKAETSASTPLLPQEPSTQILKRLSQSQRPGDNHQHLVGVNVQRRQISVWGRSPLKTSLRCCVTNRWDCSDGSVTVVVSQGLSQQWLQVDAEQ